MTLHSKEREKHKLGGCSTAVSKQARLLLMKISETYSLTSQSAVSWAVPCSSTGFLVISGLVYIFFSSMTSLTDDKGLKSMWGGKGGSGRMMASYCISLSSCQGVPLVSEIDCTLAGALAIDQRSPTHTDDPCLD